VRGILRVVTGTVVLAFERISDLGSESTAELLETEFILLENCLQKGVDGAASGKFFVVKGDGEFVKRSEVDGAAVFSGHDEKLDPSGSQSVVSYALETLIALAPVAEIVPELSFVVSGVGE
jgi:hypothetical protein